MNLRIADGRAVHDARVDADAFLRDEKTAGVNFEGLRSRVAARARRLNGVEPDFLDFNLSGRSNDGVVGGACAPRAVDPRVNGGRRETAGFKA